MKKLIALFLALLMIFTVATVAFAADETPEDPATTTTEEPTDEEGAEGEFDIMNIQIWQAKFGLKVGKILLKLVKAAVKVLIALRIIDKDEIADMVINLFGLEGADTPAEPVTEPATE